MLPTVHRRNDALVGPDGMGLPSSFRRPRYVPAGHIRSAETSAVREPACSSPTKPAGHGRALWEGSLTSVRPSASMFRGNLLQTVGVPRSRWRPDLARPRNRPRLNIGDGPAVAMPQDSSSADNHALAIVAIAVPARPGSCSGDLPNRGSSPARTPRISTSSIFRRPVRDDRRREPPRQGRPDHPARWQRHGARHGRGRVDRCRLQVDREFRRPVAGTYYVEVTGDVASSTV